MQIDNVLLEHSLTGIMIRFFFNAIVLFILIRLIYYRYEKKEEYVFSFFMMGIIIFLLTSLLETVNIQLGMALGLFAIFAILRFRTINYSPKDMTYVFIVIGVSVVNSLANIPPPVVGALLVNSLILIAALFLEIFLKNKALTSVTVVYNKLPLLNPEIRKELLLDLSLLTGLKVERVKIRKIDIARSNAELEVFFREQGEETRGLGAGGRGQTFCICLTLLCTSISVNGQTAQPMTAAAVIETIIKHTGSEPVPNTVDVFKTGDPLTPVKGIVTTMFATMDVLKKAVEMNCNLIIAHEPVFYNHRDETAQFINDPVFREKKKFIDENKLIVWRFHDYIHRIRPDAIDYGMAVKLGWLKYNDGKAVERFVVPETTLKELIMALKTIFPGVAFDVIGNPEMKLTKVAFSAGAPGSAVHYRMLEDNDVVLAGEVSQWETYEYVRDAVSQGRNKAIIFLGHVTSEEPGMEYCAQWLKGFINNIPVNFVASGPSYKTY